VERFEPLWRRALGTHSVGNTDEGIEISLEHSWLWPPWATLLLMMGLGAWVVWLYASERGRFSLRGRLCLGAIRFTLVCIVVVMMYGWTVNRHRTDMPDIVLALDDSASMDVVDDYENAQFQRGVESRVQQAGFEQASRWNQSLSLLLDSRGGWLASLAERYRLKVYRIGGTTRLLTPNADGLWGGSLRAVTPDEPSSRLGAGLQRVLDAQRGRPTAAIVLLSDGITTAGTTILDAAELARRRAVPLHIVGLGGDRRPRDIRLTDLLVDEAVFVDDIVSFDLQIQHDGFADESVVVRLLDANREVLDEQAVVLSEFGSAQPLRLSYRPRQAGLQQHSIEAGALAGEINRENNQLERAVLVRDAQIRVLFVQAYPNYEFRTLKNLLNRIVRGGTQEKVIELATVLQDGDFDFADQDETAMRVFPVNREDLFSYDVLIMGDTDPSLFSGSVMENISAFVKERGGGAVLIAGPQFTPVAWRETPLEVLFPFELATASLPDPDDLLTEEVRIVPTSLGLQTPYLQLGSSHAATGSIWDSLPALYWFLSAADLRPAARVLAEHPTLRSASEQAMPMISMQFVGAGKVVFHATDETYRWAQHHGSDVYYARYWLQLIRYLSRSKLLSDREPAEIMTDRSQYRQGEAIRIQVRFHDDRLAPPGDDGVRVGLEEVTTGRRRAIVLRRDAVERGEFSAFVNDLDSGEYRIWLVAPTLEAHPAARHLRVEPPAGEGAELEMKSAVLREAAKVSRGRFYRINQANRLLGELPRGRQVRIESLPAEPIWNSAWLALLFVALISTEWILRKRAGMI
jgi:hypothetical protein